ncbi:5-formyltetrahydrofolate cyclo-ligase [Acinetobacter stercoris]|uniref:5-formyltetrahydrofolate cyclo-ligase n=1 Tax=Acinetobacter stercoris TaxID=2126983 RepID=A0A2U3MUE0_9GAMM|nr:5-formyltetrahydrofolate cyclo-ligase [Acinetobacter stercoris]SPL69057.1 5-formyltetrahydrofolate cyclo-ligase family protein [Acinetobacter stercoris]
MKISKQSHELRKQLRKKRRNISRFQQKQTEQIIWSKLIHSSKFIHSHKIGIYLDAFGEVQTNKIIEYCFSHHKQVYLPMICNMNNKLVWVKITQHQYRSKRFSYHRLGMLEPMASRGFNVNHLDLLIMPLLACDTSGTRMGMGGGFYDRTLATALTKPFRLGLAHDFQLLHENLIRNKWDQALDALLIPHHFYIFKRQMSQ